LEHKWKHHIAADTTESIMAWEEGQDTVIIYPNSSFDLLKYIVIQESFESNSSVAW
jgi:hypothetical protein